MTRPDTVETLRHLVASALDMKLEDVRVDATWNEYEKLESFALVELLVAVQEKFGIRFQPAELRGVGSLAELAAAVEQKMSSTTTQ